MQADFDTIVIGAGVAGLAIARTLALAGHSVMVLEKAAAAGMETSSRNSEVIHAGIYYPEDSLKAALCVTGRGLLYDYCASHGVEAKRIGKLIVATSAGEEAKLSSIAELAKANGVFDLEWLTAAEARALEPEITCTRALFSPSTGIVDSRAYMLALQGETEAHGGGLAFNTSFLGARKSDGCFVVRAQTAGEDPIEITSRNLVNCAGHGAHDAARAILSYASQSLPPKFFARGHYCSLSGRTPFRHLVYPVPVSGALGIHATLDLGGAVRFGPDIEWIDALDYALPEGLPEKFSAAIAQYWPGVGERRLEPSYSGIRPKIHGPHSPFADFRIDGEAMHGIAGLVSLFGIESPGLTSSLAIADRVASQLQAA